jgi:predicted transcriptional regulator
LTTLNRARAPLRPNAVVAGHRRNKARSEDMKIGSICRRTVITIDNASPLTEAARLMRDSHVGSLVVTTSTPQGPRALGIVTDRDLTINVLSRGLDGAGVTIGDLASDAIASISEESDLSTAIATMKSAGVRRLLVVNGEQMVTGMVSFDDLMAACAGIISGLADIIRLGAEREVKEAAKQQAPQTPPVLLRIPAMGTAGWGTALA